VGQPERTSEQSNNASYDTPELTTTRALVDAVMAAVAAGDTVAARAAAKGLLAYLEALPDSNGKVLKLSDHRPKYRTSAARAA